MVRREVLHAGHREQSHATAGASWPHRIGNGFDPCFQALRAWGAGFVALRVLWFWDVACFFQL